MPRRRLQEEDDARTPVPSAWQSRTGFHHRQGHPAPSRSPVPPPAGLACTTTPWRHPDPTSASLSPKKREGAHPSPTLMNRRRRDPQLPRAYQTTTRPQQRRCRPPHSEVKTDLNHRPAPPAAIQEPDPGGSGRIRASTPLPRSGIPAAATPQTSLPLDIVSPPGNPAAELRARRRAAGPAKDRRPHSTGCLTPAAEHEGEEEEAPPPPPPTGLRPTASLGGGEGGEQRRGRTGHGS
nr:WAS/WASL-interacting protein family member 1-like [Aegilops tauschii subsp. strangulata]